MVSFSNIVQKWPIKPGLYLLGSLIFGLRYSDWFINEIYALKVFPALSFFLRASIGKATFTLGEILYLFIIILLIINIIKWLYKLKLEYKNSFFWKILIIRVLNKLVFLYVLFELIWGFNYLKKNPTVQFGTEIPSHYSEFQMDSLSVVLIQNLNESRAQIPDEKINKLNFESLRDSSVYNYQQIAISYPFLTYKYPSIKKAQFPSWGNYLGYNAFYQPLTGEAIIRADIPILSLPFTICHEMAHQLGYASESEANFIAYVITLNSKNLVFNYSMQLEIFSFAQMAELNFIAARGDFEKFKQILHRNKTLLAPKVIEDRKKMREFYTQSQKQLIHGSTELYNQFLQWNSQVKGIQSYNDVLLWVLAYKSK